MTTDPMRSLSLHHAGEGVLFRYQRLVDNKDLDGLADLVTDDVVIGRKGSEGQGREAFLALYRRFAESDVVTAQHMASNVEVRELDPDGEQARVQVDSAFLAITTHTSGEARMMWGRYTDIVVERDGQWLLASKHIDLLRTAFIEESALASPDRDSFGPRATLAAG